MLNIVVCVKAVPDPKEACNIKIDPDTKTLLPDPVATLAATERLVADGFQVDLVAAEPLVKDPVDIAWGPDGRLWVVEMADYPTGIGGHPGGRASRHTIVQRRDSARWPSGPARQPHNPPNAAARRCAPSATTCPFDAT